MKFKLFILMFFVASTATFAQIETDGSAKSTVDKEETPGEFATQAYETFKGESGLSAKQLADFDAVKAEDVRACKETREDGSCYTATTTKWDKCEDLEKEMRKGNVGMETMQYAGCMETEEGIEISLVTDEKGNPIEETGERRARD